MKCLLFIDPAKNGHNLSREQLMVVLIHHHLYMYLLYITYRKFYLDWKNVAYFTIWAGIYPKIGFIGPNRQ